MIQRLPQGFVLAALVLTTTGSPAQDAQRLRARSLAATCAPCHGTEGRAVEPSAFKALAGMPAPHLTEQMTAFKSGARAGSVMPQLAKGFSDAQIAELAAWFAQVPKPP